MERVGDSPPPQARDQHRAASDSDRVLDVFRNLTCAHHPTGVTGTQDIKTPMLYDQRMNLAPFLLDQWLEQANAPDSKIEYDLAASTGPRWTLRQLLALDNTGLHERLLDTEIVYTTPHGIPELREAIAAAHNVDPDHVQVVTGASEALLILFFLAAEPDANVVLPNPGYSANMPLANSLGIQTRNYSLRRENQFRMDLDEVRRLVDRNTRFVLVNTPHNPTGAVITDSEMQSLHDFCADRAVQLVVDEVYHPIYHGPASHSAARLPHATVLGDFSKALCVSGLRVGWMVDRVPSRRERYLNARSYFTVSNTILGERLATLAMNHRDVIYDRVRRASSPNLALLDEFFNQHRDVLAWIRPDGGMTAFPWLVDRSDARPFCREVASRGVMLAPGDCFGMPDHFRIGFAVSENRFVKGLERVAEFLRAPAEAVLSADRVR
jgi:aspartate/methionine/tyrosine aminotransferase